jgi:hypothetical protein
MIDHAIHVLLLKQVKNFISIAGPHAGTASVPLCGVSIIISSELDAFILSLLWY